MHTITLQAVKHPSRLGVLLRELVRSFDIVPQEAYEMAARDNLPPALRRVAVCAEHLDACWACWIDENGQVWFFVGELPMALSREHGKPVLQLDRYGEDGLILETSRWLQAAGKWSRLSVE
jgi:hypothetical protein